MPELRTDVEIIVADVCVEESLAAMCQRAVLVLNCVGPVSATNRGRVEKNHKVSHCGCLCVLSTGSTESQWSKLVLQAELTTWTSVVSRRSEDKSHGFFVDTFSNEAQKPLFLCVRLYFKFLERMQLEYHADAAAKGVYVIGSCGFDSIPADMGIIYTQRQFKGRKYEGFSFVE